MSCCSKYTKSHVRTLFGMVGRAVRSLHVRQGNSSYWVLSLGLVCGFLGVPVIISTTQPDNSSLTDAVTTLLCENVVVWVDQNNSFSPNPQLFIAFPDTSYSAHSFWVNVCPVEAKRDNIWCICYDVSGICGASCVGNIAGVVRTQHFLHTLRRS